VAIVVAITVLVEARPAIAPAADGEGGFAGEAAYSADLA
jgi:hypothetical protein